MVFMLSTLSSFVWSLGPFNTIMKFWFCVFSESVSLHDFTSLTLPSFPWSLEPKEGLCSTVTELFLHVYRISKHTASILCCCLCLLFSEVYFNSHILRNLKIFFFSKWPEWMCLPLMQHVLAWPVWSCTLLVWLVWACHFWVWSQPSWECIVWAALLRFDFHV